jgi:hypothetical protein
LQVLREFRFVNDNAAMDAVFIKSSSSAIVFPMFCPAKTTVSFRKQARMNGKAQ